MRKYGCERDGAWVRGQREKAGLTQPQLAQAIGTDQQKISNLERGVLRLRPHERQAIEYICSRVAAKRQAQLDAALKNLGVREADGVSAA
jgi:DNA-binding XRE family transcriptional regulator